MDLYMKSLVCFQKVAELEHITQAAKELYISQAQLSRVISELEARLDVKLFDRVGKGVRLNDSGRAFYEYTKQMLLLADSAEKRVREIYRNQRSRLTLVSNCGAYLPGALRALEESLPGLDYRVMIVARERCLTLLDEQIADFAVCCPMLEDPLLSGVLLRKEPMVVIYPEGHRFSGRENVSLQELSGEQLIAQSRGFDVRELCDRSFEKYHVEPLYRVETADSLLVPRLVAAGLGVALVPRSLCLRDQIFRTRHAGLEEPVHGLIGLSWPANRERSDDDRAMVELLRTYFVSLEE